MYESESNWKVESKSQIPPEILVHFETIDPNIKARTQLPWAEHCTDCAMPQCYSSCDLYARRFDGKCRRFVDGMVRIGEVKGLSPYLLKVRFKRWGTVFSYGNSHLLTLEQAARRERRDEWISSLIRRLPVPRLLKRKVIRKRYQYKTTRAWKHVNKGAMPSCFLLECYNPQDKVIDFSLSVWPVANDSLPPYQTLVYLQPGYNQARIPVGEIMQFVNLNQPFKTQMIPNGISDGTTLFFGAIDFVKDDAFRPAPPGEGSKCKCVVWDLDNTIWEGILMEDGPDNIKLRPGLAEVIKELDQRGILHSIASKNNYDEAIALVKHFGLDSYFLYPQISWTPKGQAVKRIAQCLNIGLDTLIFVDDSEFERAQVKHVCPQVRLLDADDYESLPNLEACRVEITSESRNRRRMYQQQAVRELVLDDFQGNYESFLRDCRIHLEISTLTEADLQRVHELTQRTNQMNFSGHRYDREVLNDILHSEDLHTFVMKCRDRFGSYGTIGFAIIDFRQTLMTDLMFSCRIQSKRVEHAFLSYVLNKYVAETGNDFRVDYRKTKRNAQAGKVFDDFKFELEDEKDGVYRLVFRNDRHIPDDSIIDVSTCEGTAS